MKRRIFQAISWISLAGTIAPPILYLFGSMEFNQVKQVTLACTVLWFIFTPLWMGRDNQAAVV